MKSNSKKLPSRILYTLSGIIVVVFALFWLVGFDTPYIDDPNFNAPLFTDVVMVLMMLMVAASAALVVWAVARHFKTANRKEKYDNNIPVRRLGLCVSGGTVAALVITFALGSSAPMKINGTEYADAFWLRVSDMFVCTSALLILAAAAAVVYGSTKYIRKP